MAMKTRNAPCPVCNEWENQYDAAVELVAELRANCEKWAKDYMKLAHEMGGVQLELTSLRAGVEALADEWSELGDYHKADRVEHHYAHALRLLLSRL